MKQAFLQALSAFIEAQTGVSPQEGDYKLSKDGLLSCRSFVRRGSGEAAAKLKEHTNSFLFQEIRPVEGVEERNGWLLLTPSHAFYRWLTDYGCSLPALENESYLANRLKILARKGEAPCPAEPRVQRVLLEAFWGIKGAEADRRLLTMTHIDPPPARIAMENNCGSVARALLGLRGGYTAR